MSKEPVAAQSREKIIAKIQQLPDETKFIVLSPYARGKKAEFKEDFAELFSKGFMRLRVDGAWVELGEIDRLDGSIAHDIDLVIDRLMAAEDNKSRIAEAANLRSRWAKVFSASISSIRGEETSFLNMPIRRNLAFPTAL